MPAEPQPALTRSRVISCVLINQLATPGLGSLLCRRIFSGTCQLLLAVAGFILLTDWMFRFFHRLALREFDEPAPQTPLAGLAKWGLILFGIGWLWSLGTSFLLLRQTKGQTEPVALPPRGPAQPPIQPGSAN